MKSTRFPNGITNVPQHSPLGGFGMLDPTVAHVFFDDFDRYVAADWTVTTVDGGTDAAAVRALVDGDGGLFSITNDDADDDANFLQKKGESFRFASGKELWFKARWKLGDATESDAVMGLQITDTTPLAVTDGVYFLKADGAASLAFYVTKNSTQSSKTAIATMVNDTFIETAFHYDGRSVIEIWVDGEAVGSLPVINLPDDEDLTVSFGVQNGAAAAKSMIVDYIFAARQR